MRDKEQIIKDLHARLTVLAGLQGEDCPKLRLIEGHRKPESHDTSELYVYEWECQQIDEWLQKAPPPDSPEYTTMRDEYIAKLVAEELSPIKLPHRHARQTVQDTNMDWTATLHGVGKRLAEHEDAMIALLGPRGTGKTQMAIELIRFMARHKVEVVVKPVHRLERWAWEYQYDRPSPVAKGFALHSNTMDFFLRLRKTFQPDSEEREENVLDEFIRPSLLILDEAHDRRGSDWENQMFTYLIDRRYQSASKQTIFIANQKKEIFEANIGNSIADRLEECGGVIWCDWKSFRCGK